MRWRTGLLVTTLTTVAFISAASLTPEHSADGQGTAQNTILSTSVDDQGTRVTNTRQIHADNLVAVDGTNNQKITKIVTTTFGKVTGYPWHDSDEILSYIDIPYGKFKFFEKPSDPDKRDDNDIHDVKDHISKCPQLKGDKYVGTEDCLTLSVFAPKQSAAPAGVLFYIHESDFKFGSGDPAIYGPEYLVKKGLILVLPNYRLGALGFLCMQNSTAPGNAALKDLALALNWTANNIAGFGGDPKKIVVSGDGKSGALASYLALSSETRNYVSKVISESGSVLSHWAIDRNPVVTGTKLAEQIRSSTATVKSNVFSEIDIELLIKSAKDIDLKPCVENHNNDPFIVKTPWTIMTKEKISMSFILGSANHAGLREAIKYDAAAISKLNEDFGSALPNDLHFSDDKSKKDVVERTKKQYFGDEEIKSDDTKKISLYHSDASYLGPDIREARALVNSGAKVFLYEFSYKGKLNTELANIDSEKRYGATRGDIVGYLFSHNSDLDTKAAVKHETSTSLTDTEIVELMTNLWSSFINTERPTIDDIKWNYLKETGCDECYLSIGEEVEPRQGFHADRLDLWTDVYNKHFIENMAISVRAASITFFVALIYLIRLVKNILL